MGNLFSSRNDNLVTKEELANLISSIDKNHDDVITKNEVKSYIDEQLYDKTQEIQEWKLKYSNLLLDYKMLLEENMIKTRDTQNEEDVQKSTISVLALQDHIQNEILDSESNIKWVPDPIERRAYLTVYKSIMEAIQQLSNTTSLTILNHKVNLHVEPLEKYK